MAKIEFSTKLKNNILEGLFVDRNDLNPNSFKNGILKIMELGDLTSIPDLSTLEASIPTGDFDNNVLVEMAPFTAELKDNKIELTFGFETAIKDGTASYFWFYHNHPQKKSETFTSAEIPDPVDPENNPSTAQDTFTIVEDLSDWNILSVTVGEVSAEYTMNGQDITITSGISIGDVVTVELISNNNIVNQITGTVGTENSDINFPTTEFKSGSRYRVLSLTFDIPTSFEYE
jgi:hypothetical protein